MSNIVLRQDEDGRMVVQSQLPSQMDLDIHVRVQYFAISDQWRARTNGINRASGEPFISEPYRNPVFAVCNLLVKLANYTDPDSSLALEGALNAFLKNDNIKKPQADEPKTPPTSTPDVP